MRYLNKIATIFCAAALGILSLTSCEGADLYDILAPDWISEKADSIKNANTGGEEELVGMMEDVYTIGATDYSTGWWAAFSKYYQIPEGQVWNAQFNLNINPSASNTYKNFALIISNDEDRGAADYKEYGAIRYDNQPSGNSEWGDYIDRSLVTSTLTFNTDTDTGVDKLGGKVTLTIDRSNGGLTVKINNGSVVKTYIQTAALANLNTDVSNTTIRAFLVPEGSYINWINTNIEPIGGCTSAEDKQPLSMVLNNVPRKVLLGTELADAIANVTATVQFEQEVSKTVTAEDLKFEAIPNMDQTGTKTLVAVYNKTYKGENCSQPIIAYATFEVVEKMYNSVGATDNSSPFAGDHSDDIKVGPGETFITTFTNYTDGTANWNNFMVELFNADKTTYYATVRADNFGWGTGYGACTAIGTQGDWATWLKAMDGAKVTAYITNNGDGTADIKAVMIGNDGNTYTQEYNGINNIEPNDMWFHLIIEKSHLEFDNVVGAEDNSSPFAGGISSEYKVPAGATYVTRFTNYTDGAANWNNFMVELFNADKTTYYATVRADNFGWGTGYGACTAVGTQGDWATWLKAMDGAQVTTYVTNNGDGTANIKAVMVGNDGNTYTQEYNGIDNIEPDDMYFHFIIEKSHLVFE